MVFSIQEFFLFTQELIHFTQEILPLLPKKLRAPYSRNLRVPTNDANRLSVANAALSLLPFVFICTFSGFFHYIT